MTHKLALYPASNLSLAFKIATLLVVPSIVYSQDLLAIANEAVQSELASYMLAIPFLIGYVVYRKRNVLRTTMTFRRKKQQRFLDEIAGVLLCFLALALYLHGSYTFYPLELHLVSLPIFVAGCILILFNWETLRTLSFPTAILLMLAVPPLEIAFLAGATLSNAGSQIAYALLKLLGLPVDLSYLQFSPIIVLHSTSGVPLEFAVQVASSGIYSLLGFTVFAVFAAYIIRRAFWKKIVVLLLGFLLIFASNIIRLSLIVSIGYWFGQSVAMDVFHMFGGWVLIFVSTFLLLFLGEKVLKIRIFTSKTDPTSCVNCAKAPEDSQDFCPGCGRLLRFPKVRLSSQEMAKVFALILSTFLYTYIQVPLFVATQGPAELILQTPYGLETSEVLPEVSNYTVKFSYRDTSFEQRYGQEASLVYMYTSRSSYPITTVALEISNKKSVLHNWEICYHLQEQVGAFKRLDLRDVQILQNPQVIGRFYSFQVVRSGGQVVSKNYTETIFYWFTTAAFDTGNRVEWKYVKISVWIDGFNLDYREVEEMLLTFGKAIASYWEPIKSWSLLAIAAGQHRFALVATATSLLLFTIVSNVLKDWKDKRLSLRLYERLNDEDKLILLAVRKAAHEGRPTTNAIASAYERLSSQRIEQPMLLEKLKYAEEADLVKEYIAEHNDNPVLVRKLNFKIRT